MRIVDDHIVDITAADADLRPGAYGLSRGNRAIDADRPISSIGIEPLNHLIW